jgi:Putative metal-binding motif/WD40-like Beta Propeller Repeat
MRALRHRHWRGFLALGRAFLACAAASLSLPASTASAAIPGDCTELGVAITEHSCFHSEFGPFDTVMATAGTEVSAATPHVNSVHTEYRIGLTGEYSTVTYTPERSGAWAVLLGKDVPIQVLAGKAEAIPAILDQKGSTGCDALPLIHVFQLAKQQQYRFVFGPTADSTVVAVVEYIDDFLTQNGRDDDGDGFGSNAEVVVTPCRPPVGFAPNTRDCDDTDAAINPAAEEVCDGVDQNCNGVADDSGLVCRAGRGACRAEGTLACAAGSDGPVCSATPLTGSDEECNGIDDDCNGKIDDAVGMCPDPDRPTCVRRATTAACGCLLDLDCGDATSARICDVETGTCEDGCSPMPGRNGCPSGEACDEKTARCEAMSGVGGGDGTGGAPDGSGGVAGSSSQLGGAPSEGGERAGTPNARGAGEEDGGCGCRVAGRPGTSGSAAACLSLGIAAAYLRRRRLARSASPLVLGVALATAVACGDDAEDADAGDGPGAAGMAGASGKSGGEAAGSSGKAGTAGTPGVGGDPSVGGVGVGGGAGEAGEQSGGSSSGDGGGGVESAGGQGGASTDTCGGELLPPLTRWTAYVVENDVAQATLFATNSAAPGAPVTLLEAESPITSLTWSPNGRFLAFVLDQGAYASSLHVVDFSGEEPSAVVDVATEANETPGSPRWSPDSTRLLYAEPGFTTELRVVDFSSGTPGETVVFGNCPQGAYSDLPCLGAYVHPLRLDWSPTGDALAGVFVSQFFAEFGAGSGADLFLLRPAPEVKGQLASPFVPSFDPPRRGVTPSSFVWSPDGARVAYTGSFEDTGSVSEAYVFAVSGASSPPIKLHADVAEPKEGVLPSLTWASATTVVFASDANATGARELFSVDVSAPNLGAEPLPTALLSAAGGSVLAFALSPDRRSLLVLRQASAGETATLAVFPYGQAPLSLPLEVSSTVATVGDGFTASAQWSRDSKLLAFVDDEATRLKIAGWLPDDSSCIATSVEVESPTATWHWLADESSLVVLDATGIHRLHAGSASAELLSAPLEANESISGWAVQPRGEQE